jgi:methyltransferase
MMSLPVAAASSAIAIAVLLTMALEAQLSAHNERVLRARGAVEPEGDVIGVMTLAYPLGFVLIALAGAFNAALDKETLLWGLALLVASKGLKFWAIASLGSRWTFRVLVLPGAPLVAAGPYAWMRHPNYVAVLGEYAGVALAVWAPFTGLLVMAGFGYLMWRRIGLEERALGLPQSHDHPGPVPVLATVADVVTVVIACLAAWVSIVGSYRLGFGSVRTSTGSPLRLLLIAAVLALARHAWHRRPTLVARLKGAGARLAAVEGLGAVWPAALGSRVLVALVGFVAVFAIGFPTERLPFVTGTVFSDLFARWDAGWYLGIAQRGYHYDHAYGGQQNVAFFPAYPFAMAAVSVLMGGSPSTLVVIGVVLSTLAFVAACTLLYRLARAVGVSPPDERAELAVVLLAAYPFAVFYGQVYTESLFLLCAVGCFLSAERGRWPAAAAFGFVGALTRPNGFLLAVPVALIAARSLLGEAPGGRWRVSRGMWLAVVAPVAGVAIHSIHIGSLTGDPFAWAAMQVRWGRTFTVTGRLEAAFEYIAQAGVLGYMRTEWPSSLEALAALLALAATIPVTRRLGLAYGAYMLVNLLPPLLMGGTLSVGRLSATLFPMFLWVAGWWPRRAAIYLSLACAVGQGLLAALFFTWRPPY